MKILAKQTRKRIY